MLTGGKLLAGLGMCIAIFPATAPAAFPGKNGPLVLSIRGTCEFHERYLATTPWRGGELTWITDPCPGKSGAPRIELSSPDASPDGSSIIAQGMEWRDTTGQHFSFATMAADGSGRQDFDMPLGGEGMTAPSFAPSGSRFAFAADNTIWTANTDGSDAERLRPAPDCGGPGFTSRDCTWFRNPRWSPDGELIAAVAEHFNGDLPGEFEAEPGIWLMRADDGTLVRRIAKRGDWVDWSPNGRKLVFGTPYGQKSEDGGAAGGNLYIVNRDGTGRRTLLHRENIAETEPAWSPNGRWVSFLSLKFGGGDVAYDIRLSLWRIRTTGRRLQRVRSLPAPTVEEGEWTRPSLAWLPRPD